MFKKLLFFLFISLLGGTSVFAANRSTVFYTYTDNLYSNYGRLLTTDSVQFAINIHGTSNASLNYRACNGFTYTYGVYWSEYFAWMVIPKKVSANGYTIYLDIQYRGNWSIDSEDNDNYYLVHGFGWDQPTAGGGVVCPQYGDTRPLSWTFGSVTLNAYLPVDLPKGSYSFPVKFLRGIQRNNFDYLGGRYKIPSSQMKSIPFNSVYNLSMDITGGCYPSSQVLDINHGNIAINQASGNIASQKVSVYCDVPATINVSLMPNTPGNYSNVGTSVGLGNGWDSIVSLDGIERNRETLRWNRAGSKTITVGSRLYGESGKIKPGNLSGSMTMVFSIR